MLVGELASERSDGVSPRWHGQLRLLGVREDHLAVIAVTRARKWRMAAMKESATTHKPGREPMGWPDC